MVGLGEAQSVDHKQVGVAGVGGLAEGNALHVGDIDKRRRGRLDGSDAETEDGDGTVHDAQRGHAKVADGERHVRFHLHEIDTRHAGIFVLHETVGHVVADVGGGAAVGVDVDVAEDAERSQVIHSPDVVIVGVGDEDAVNLPERLGKHLLAEVGAAVDE